MSTIAAISTPYGTGGIAVIRLSGPDAIAIADRVWRGRPLAAAASHTAHLGVITAADGSELDRAVATIFRGPRSFTGEDTVEFSVHGSKWIQREVTARLVEAGAVPAEAGEFTRRAFVNGRMDLTQAEGVADLIAASSRAAHRLAMRQMAGGFSARLNELRERLVELASLLELELDFSEEDVEFADRARLRAIADETLDMISRLASTYAAGRAIKEGVPVAIAGRPNAGKSTLLNRLLDEDKAIVSEIPGTTRDIIDGTREIDGILFRFYDTAGLRDTDDTVERIGIDRARAAIDRAAIVLWLHDPSETVGESLPAGNDDAFADTTDTETRHIHLITKSDIRVGREPEVRESVTEDIMQDGRYVSGEDVVEKVRNYTEENGVEDVKDCAAENVVEKDEGCEEGTAGSVSPYKCRGNILHISAKTGENIDRLEHMLVEAAKTDHNPDAELIITNARHHAELLAGAEALRRARAAMDDGLSADFIAQDIREALTHLGLLTGAVTTDTLLQSIFTRFCVGK